MFKRKAEHPGIAKNNENLPHALGLKEIRRQMEQNDRDYDRNDAGRDKPCDVHNRAMGKALRQSGITVDERNRACAPIGSKLNKGGH
jgi:hypothetical protein